MAGGGKPTRLFRPGNFNEPGISRQFRAGEYLKFQRKLKKGFQNLLVGGALAAAELAYELGRTWVTIPRAPHTGDLLAVPAGSAWSRCVNPTVACETQYGPVTHQSYTVGVGCSWGSCMTAQAVALGLDPLGSPIPADRSEVLYWANLRNPGPSNQTGDMISVWTRPDAASAAFPPAYEVGFTFPLDAPAEWLSPKQAMQLAPRPLRRPWLDRDPSGRPHPLADHIPAMELRFPARRASHSASARRRVVRHRQRPDRARKGSGALPKGMVAAMGLFHAATELKDFIDAMYDAVPRWRRRGVGNGWFERMEAIASNWDAFLEPEVARTLSEICWKTRLRTV